MKLPLRPVPRRVGVDDPNELAVVDHRVRVVVDDEEGRHLGDTDTDVLVEHQSGLLRDQVRYEQVEVVELESEGCLHPERADGHAAFTRVVAGDCVAVRVGRHARNVKDRVPTALLVRRRKHRTVTVGVLQVDVDP